MTDPFSKISFQKSVFKNFRKPAHNCAFLMSCPIITKIKGPIDAEMMFK